jgi:hypothetical protein
LPKETRSPSASRISAPFAPPAFEIAILAPSRLRSSQAPVRQPQLLDQRRVARRLLEHRVDQDRRARPARPAIAQQITVGRGLRVEELPEDKHVSPRLCALPHTQISGQRVFANPAGRIFI